MIMLANLALTEEAYVNRRSALSEGDGEPIQANYGFYGNPLYR